MRGYNYADLATYLEGLIKHDLPDHATADFDRVRSGDDAPNDILDRERAAGAELIFSCPNDMRGMVATWLYYRYRAGDVAQSIYREALNAAWSLDHHQVRQFVRNNRLRLRSMFQQAGFPVPKEMPDQVNIWRGGAGLSASAIQRGISWTTDRDVACWFATHWGTNRFSLCAEALVIKATVPKSLLVIPWNERRESEAIFFDGQKAQIVVHGDATDWWSAGERHAEIAAAIAHRALAT
jgi:hypothetical protein